ncbi:MAG: prolipoprotein diacylglyceryl transferase family protein, partial [Acidimicrobiia bacterium]
RLHYGQLFSFWIVWYGLQRFILDFLRFGSGDRTIGAFTWNQLSGLAAALLGVGLFVWFRRQPEVSAVNDETRSGLTPV